MDEECLLCNEIGHEWFECSKKIEVKEKKEDKSKTKPIVEPDTVKKQRCGICKMRAHNRRTCPFFSTSDCIEGKYEK